MFRVRNEIKENKQNIKISTKRFDELILILIHKKRKEATNEADKNHFK